MRVFFAIGPGDAVTALRDWEKGYRTPTETSRTFSGLCYDFIKQNQHHAFVVSSHPNVDAHRVGNTSVQNLPKLELEWLGKALGFHFRQAIYALKLTWLAVKFRADVAVVDSGTTHWFMLTFMRLVGISVIPNFHNVYKNLARHQSALSKLIQRLDSSFFSLCVKDALGVSPACQREFPENSHGVKWHIHYAQFAPSDFEAAEASIPHPINKERPFRLVFAGRIEENKGVFDLVDIAKKLRAIHSNFQVTVCGAGPALPPLKQRISEATLGDFFDLKGKLARAELLEVYRQNHAVIVPTKLSFCEGLPLVCAEASLSKKPVISSEISNAVDIFGNAMLIAKTDDVDSYAACIKDLMENSAKYQQAVQHTMQVSRRFVDPKLGLDAVLSRVIQ